MAAEAAQQGGDRPFDGVLRREIDVEFRALNKEERSFEVVASTETLDSHGDIVKAFWDLSRYEKNGVVLWNHNIALYMRGSAEETLPIGKGVARVEGKKLVAKITLLKGDADDEPLVDKIWRRVEQDVIRAVSVGFRPGQVTRIVDPDGSTNHYELGSKERPNELREISLVPMGSNPDAVAKSIAWERKHLETEATKTIAASAADPTKETAPMAMTPEEQKALTDAQAAKTVAETSLTTEREKVKTLETSLIAEKAISKKLDEELTAARLEVKTLKGDNSKIVLDGLQSVKFAPAEREELDKLVADVGIDRVKSLLEKRADITLTQPATVEGKELGDKNKGAPPPVEGASPDAASDDFLKSVSEATAKVA